MLGVGPPAGFFHRVSLFVRLISHQPAVLFSQNKPATSNQSAVLFSHNKSASAISHQPNEQTTAVLSLDKTDSRSIQFQYSQAA
jgi:hypothetical protein